MSEKTIWTILADKLGNEYGAAGLMGNLYAESGLIANNLQNTYQSKLGFTDETYTAAVDSGAYTNFVHDSAGYGLAQWTYWTRKRDLLDFAKRMEKSIGDEEMQVAFLLDELGRLFSGVLFTLRTADSVKEASDVVLTQFERPADMSGENKARRAAIGQAFYEKYAAKEIAKPVETDGSSWSKEAREWAVENGLFIGNGQSYNWKAPVTREELAVILHRYANK